MISTTTDIAVIRRTDELDRIAYAELLVPGERSTFGDKWTEDGIRQAVEAYATHGYGLDIDHDEQDITGPDGIVVVESFIAREGDSTFVPGSWVIAIKFNNDALWQKVLSGELNGLSYQAIVIQEDEEYEDPGNTVVVGSTLPAQGDSHTHEFTVIINSDGRVISGGTDTVDGHWHLINQHTVTEMADGHTHRISIPDFQTEDEL